MAEVLSGSVATSSYTNSSGKTRNVALEWTATQNIANNTTTISWKVVGRGTITGSSYVKVGAVSATIDGETVYSRSSSASKIELTYGYVLASGTKTVTHNSSTGKRIVSMGVSACIYSYSTPKTGSATFELKTIARASTLTVSNGTLGTAQTINATRQNSAFTHTITWNTTSQSGTIATKSTGTSFSFTPPIACANDNTTSTSVSMRFIITTYSGSTTIGSNTYYVQMAIPSSVTPKITSVKIEDTTGNQAKYGWLKGLSIPKATITADLSSDYKATVKSYSVTIDGTTYSTNPATANKALSTAGSVTITAKITDSRGRTATKNETISVVDYARPKITYLAVHRTSPNDDGTQVEDEQGNYVTVTYKSSVTSLNGNNTASLSLTYMPEGNEIGTTIQLPSNTDGEYTFEADADYAYAVELTVSDNFASTTQTTSASSGKIFVDFPPSNTGLGIGGDNTHDNGLDVYFDVYVGKKAEQMVKQPVFQYGSVVVTPSSANVPEMVEVTFDVPFASTPNIVLSPWTSAPGTAVKGVSYANATNKGFNIYLTRSDTTSTGVSWLAIGTI